MMELSEIRQRLESRLAYVQKEIDYVKSDINNVYKHNHYLGYLQELEGTFGEKQFLTKLIAEMGDEDEQHGI